MERRLNFLFETEMPSAETRPLFEQAARLGVGFYLGSSQLTVESGGRRRQRQLRKDDELAVYGMGLPHQIEHASQDLRAGLDARDPPYLGGPRR